LKESKVLEVQKEEFINKLQIFLLSVVLIMIKTHKLQKIFMQLYKINFTLLSQVKQLLKSDTIIAKNYLQEDEIKKLLKSMKSLIKYKK
jgi:hypothetical protein